MIRFDHDLQFVTITNLNWLPVLNNDFHKQILLEAFGHRVKLKKVSIYAFVIIPNHFHVIWQLHDGIATAEGYEYSSASFYETGNDDLGFWKIT
ncbi:MAG TPA: hypothetical protein VIH86_07305 [Puia sp.]|jgi:hypothetical protein